MREYERMHWAVFEQPENGKVKVVNLFEMRIRKMQRRIGAWAEVVEVWRKDNPCTLVMVTLTYEKKGDYEQGHIREYLNRLRGMLKDRLLAWAWVAEIQKRGAVHYHLLIVVEKFTRVPMPDKQGHWKHGMSQVVRARTAYYLVKYLGKEYQKDLARYPKGCRTYAASIRFGGKTVKELYRRLAGLGESAAEENEWRYRGSSVTEQYARNVLVPS